MSRKRSPRISATIATASLNSSNVMRRSERGFTLLKMMSTLVLSTRRPSCRPVSRQNLAHFEPSMVSERSSPRTPKLANSAKTSRKLASAPEPRLRSFVPPGERNEAPPSNEALSESLSGKEGNPPRSSSSSLRSGSEG